MLGYYCAIVQTSSSTADCLMQGRPRAPQLLPRQAFTGEPASLPDISPLYVNSRGFTPHLQHETPNFAGEQIAGRNLVSLHSYNSSEGSGWFSYSLRALLLCRSVFEDFSVLSQVRSFGQLNG